MTEPITPAVAHGSTLGITVAGASAAVTAALGVDATTICWALAGGWFGSSLAPKVGPVATVVQFLLASLLSALGATAAAEAWALRPTSTHLLAATLSMSFYALRRAVLSRATNIIDRLLDRFWPGTTPPPTDGGKDL